MKPGTKIEVIVHGGPNETAKIMKPHAENLPLPGPGWHIVRFDADGAKMCIHQENFVLC